MNDRKTLLHRIQVCDFALYEVGLYLDTHPNDKQALEYYGRHLEMSNKAREEYVNKFGPLSARDYNGGSWKWTDDPWPWETEER